MADNLQTAKRQVAQARSQLAEQRKQISQKRSEAKKQEQLLEETKSRLPSRTSQRALRQQMAGLEGRTKRRKIALTEKKISGEKEKVRGFLGDLKGYESELQKYEEEKIKPVERQIQDYELRQQAYKQANKIIADDKAGLYLAFMKSGDASTPRDRQLISYIRGYLKEYQTQKRLSRESFSRKVQIEQAKLPKGEKLVVDWKNLKVSGIQSGSLGQTLSIKNYNSKIEDIKIKESKVPTLNVSPQQVKVKQNLFQRVGQAISNVPFFETTLGGVGKKATPAVRSVLKPGQEVFEQSVKFGSRITPKLTSSIKNVLDKPLPMTNIRTGDVATKATQLPSRVPFFDRSLAQAPEFVSSGLRELGREVQLSREVGRKISPAERFISSEFKEKRASVERNVFQKAIPKAGEIATTSLAFSAPVVGQAALGAEFLSTAEKGRTQNLQRETKRIIEKQYEEYKKQPVEEGFRRLTKEEFTAQATPQVRQDIKRGLVTTGVLTGAAIGAGGILGASKGITKIKNNAITKSIQKEINFLEGSKVPLKTFNYIDETKGIVQAKGFVSVGGVKKEVEYVGRLAKTEKGFKFIPEGTGGITYRGVSQPNILGAKLKPRSFISATEFELGAKGGSRYVGSLGDLKFFEEFGTSTVRPVRNYLGITTLKKGGITSKNLRELDTQLSVARKPQDITYKDITAPIGQRNTLIEFNDKLGLRINPQETGLIVKAPKPKTNIGFKGKGQSSSSQFFQGLYSQKVSAPNLGLISKRIKPEVQVKTQPKTITTSPKTSSAFVGTGLYERTESQMISPKIISMQPQQSRVEPGVISIPRQRSINILGFETKQRISQLTKQKSRDFQGVSPTQETIFRQPQKEKSRGIAKQMIELLQINRQKTMQGTKITTGTKKNIQSAKSIIRVKPKPKKTAKSIIKSFTGGKTQNIELFVRKKGEDISIGKARTEEEAKKTLKGILGKTLRASGFAVVGGKRTFLDLGAGFRRSKKDTFRIVQDKTKRFGTVGETREAQKKRKSKWGF